MKESITNKLIIIYLSMYNRFCMNKCLDSIKTARVNFSIEPDKNEFFF